MIIQGDCIEVMKSMPDNSIDSIVTDPPYEIGFMGKSWDNTGIAYNVDMWKECLRVLKHGGHLLAFSGTRTYHRMACAIEDAGFEVRDMIEWVYGCLSEDTEILTINGWEQYHKDIDKHLVLCYNMDRNSFEFNKPLRSFIYENKHTAYRIKSNFTDQIVSRNHRCIVERDGRKLFVYAETLECQENIPFLESLSDLPETIYNANEGTSITKHDLLTRVQECDFEKQTPKTDNTLDGDNLSCVRKNISDKKSKTIEILFKRVQWADKGSRVENTSTYRAQKLETRKRTSPKGKNDWMQKPCMERWGNILQKTWELFANKVCQVSKRVFGYGKERWLCNGTSSDNGTIAQQMFGEDRSGASHQSQSTGQQNREPNVVYKQSETQTVRSTRATIEPIEYNGNVWCVEVPTGAFVARRSGKIFITGNSGFPKSLNISKQIDKQAGVERKVIGIKPGHEEFANRTTKGHIDFKDGTDGFDRPWMHDDGAREKYHQLTEASSPEAKQWEGFGTALKPAHEPICLARKPLEKGLTIAENCLKWGTGGLDIDGCRVETQDNLNGGAYSTGDAEHMWSKNSGGGGLQRQEGQYQQPTGRFPANLILSDSDEVRECFPETGKGNGGIPYVYAGREYSNKDTSMFNGDKPQAPSNFNDSGSASRFFKSIIYQAKASKSERTANGTIENNHPTVKPVALMEYLVKMVTREGQTTLDPFCGSGSTGVACNNLGVKFIGIDLEESNIKIAKARTQQYGLLQQEAQ